MSADGTSTAAPVVGGAALLARQFLRTELSISNPDSALIKAVLINGARDIGTANVPNMDEGWGQLDLEESLYPHEGVIPKNIFYDTSQTLSPGLSYAYNYALDGSYGLDVTLVWNDREGSSSASQSSSRLISDLDLTVTSPDGTTYKGNDFANGRSTTGGDADDVNNVEVVLVDQADAGVWTVRITDVAHGGQRSDQPFALAVRGAGVNDLRSDPLPIPTSFQLSTAIPQVNEVCQISIQIENQGGGSADGLRVEAIAGTQNLGDVEIDIGPGMIRWVTWDWTPINEGTPVSYTHLTLPTKA